MLGDIFLTFFAFFLATLITSLIFGVWLVVSIVRLVVHVLQNVARALVGLPRTRNVDHKISHCTRDKCGAPNPVEAKFCRRCGQRLAKPQHVIVRRAAAVY